MAARFIAGLLLTGSGILARAFLQAYQKALQNAAKNGTAQSVAAEALQRSRARAMTLQEARLVLGVSEDTPWQEVLERYKRLFENNERVGSFYLQSKVQRAKECIEAASGPEATAESSSSSSSSAPS